MENTLNILLKKSEPGKSAGENSFDAVVYTDKPAKIKSALKSSGFRIYYDDLFETAPERSCFNNFCPNGLHSEYSEADVSKILRILRMPVKSRGYRYLLICILLVAGEPAYLTSVTGMLYPEVARGFNTTPAGVEAAVRRCIKCGLERCGDDIFRQYFGYTYDRNIKSSEFIACIAERIRFGR